MYRNIATICFFCTNFYSEKEGQTINQSTLKIPPPPPHNQNCNTLNFSWVLGCYLNWTETYIDLIIIITLNGNQILIKKFKVPVEPVQKNGR